MSKIALTASMGWDFESDTEGRDVVVVRFGDTEIAKLTPARESKAGGGDASSYFRSEEQAIVEETVAPYLRRLFEESEA